MSDALSRRRLKAWIRLLGITRQNEQHLRAFLRQRHDTTLPRFDVMAALYRRHEGATMADISRFLLVSNGNAMTVVDRLEQEGLVTRKVSDTDRRVIHVAMTAEGLRQFEGLAAEHEAEVNAQFGMLSEDDLDRLTDILKRMGGGGIAR